MKTTRTILVILTLLIAGWMIPGSSALALGHDLGEPETEMLSEDRETRPYDIRFLHVATADNTVGAVTYLNHPQLNENPSAVFFVTKNGNAGGGFSGTINEHHIGVWYNGTAGRWAIINQDLASMPVGSDYNILIPGYGGFNKFVHTVTSGNQSGNYTHIDNPLLNENPDAVIFITQVVNPGGGTEYYNNHPVGVWYDPFFERWSIFNQDGAGMNLDRSFFVLVPETSGGAVSYVHTASADTLQAGSTLLDHPDLNDDTHALIFLTQNWNPGGSGGTYNAYTYQAYYNPLYDQWGITNLEVGTTVNMTEGASFNVLFFPGEDRLFRHHSTDASTRVTLSVIDEVAQSWNINGLFYFTYHDIPGGISTLNQNISLRYDYGTFHWSLFMTDTVTDFPDDAVFNMLLPNMDAGVFFHQAEAANIAGNWTYLEHPLTDNEEDAVIFVNHTYSVSGEIPGLASDHVIGVWYDTSVDHWAIFNQDGVSMAPGASFNIFIPHPGDHVFIHEVTSGNGFGPYTVLDHPLLNDNPSVSLFITQNWNPGGSGGVYNNSPVGVRYDAGRWEIWNQNGTDISVGASFNVFVISEDVYLPLVLR
jgi:hypothetical protein